MYEVYDSDILCKKGAGRNGDEARYTEIANE